MPDRGMVDVIPKQAELLADGLQPVIEIWGSE